MEPTLMRRPKNNEEHIVAAWHKYFVNNIGIDLGTANTLVYVSGRNIVINEPSYVAVDTITHKPVAVGTDAKEMFGREPPNIRSERPLRDGVIADFELAEELIRSFISQASPARLFIRPRVVVCVPSGVTGVEKRAVRDAAERAGAKDVRLVYEPMAAAIGCGLPVEEPVGSMIIDIGGGTSEIAVISLGGIVVSASIRTGGDEMDQAIIQHVRKQYNLAIGTRMAETVKKEIGSAFAAQDEETMEVKGLDLVQEAPRAIKVSSEEIREALAEPVNYIVAAVRETLQQTPAELAADLIDRGIVMSGGGSLLHGLDRRIQVETNLPVRLDEDCATGVVRGTGKILENFSGYESMLEIVKD